MIYSVLNNHSSFSTSSYEANSKYYGAGAFNFMSECAKDELEIFENAITTDMHEVVVGESYEMEAINEGFFENVWNKIKEIFKKFIEWIKAVTRSAVAKLANLLIRDNKEFAKFARKKISAMKNRGKFEYSGKVLKNTTEALAIAKTSTEELKDFTKIEALITTLDSKNLTLFTEPVVKKAESMIEEINEKSVTDIMEEITDDVTDAKISVVMDHIKVLEGLSNTVIDKIKKDLKKYENTCQKAINKAEKIERTFDDEEKYNKSTDKATATTRDNLGDGKYGTARSTDFAETKKLAQNAVTVCNAYKTAAQSMTSIQLSLTKSIAKVARTVVAKAAGATPKNEGYYDEELLDAMNEAVLYEYDEALESMGESKKEDIETLDDSDEEENED